MLKRSEVLANRLKWIDFLEVKSRRKTTGWLDDGNGKRCCLGHACYVLGIEKTKNEHDGGRFRYAGETAEAPQELIDMVGLWSTLGSAEANAFLKIRDEEYESLAAANDGNNSDMTGKGQSPQAIGSYLRTVINGGSDTPFTPLDGYPE